MGSHTNQQFKRPITSTNQFKTNQQTREIIASNVNSNQKSNTPNTFNNPRFNRPSVVLRQNQQFEQSSRNQFKTNEQTRERITSNTNSNQDSNNQRQPQRFSTNVNENNFKTSSNNFQSSNTNPRLDQQRPNSFLGSSSFNGANPSEFSNQNLGQGLAFQQGTAQRSFQNSKAQENNLEFVRIAQPHLQNNRYSA